MIRQGYPHPIAYTFDADYHCPVCTERRFGVDEHGFPPEDARDSEGNPIGAVAPWDEWHEPSEPRPHVLACGSCRGEIDRIEDELPAGWTACEQCGAAMNPAERMLGAVCGRCCRANHRRACPVTPAPDLAPIVHQLLAAAVLVPLAAGILLALLTLVRIVAALRRFKP